MAIAEVVSQRNSNSPASANSVALAWPAVPTPGNLMVACLSHNSANSIATVPAGWTLITYINGVTKFRIYYKVAGAGEPQNPTWTQNTTGPSTIQGYEFSGVNPVPLDDFGENVSVADGTALSINVGMPATSGQMALTCYQVTTSMTLSGYNQGQTQALTSTGAASAGRLITTLVFNRPLSSPTYTATANVAGAWAVAYASFKAGPVANNTGFMGFFD